MKLKFLELFAGSAVLSNTFKEHGHEVITLDFNPAYNPDICIDILDFDISMLNGFKPDIIHASPECRCFSVASIGTHWTGGKEAYIPKTDDAKNAIAIVKKTINIINTLSPVMWYIENPEDVLWKLGFMKELIRKNYFHRVTYCRYGDRHMKPTCFLTNNNTWISRPRCKNGHPDHERAPRGSKTGTQGLKNAYERSKIPKSLCLELLKASEDEYASIVYLEKQS